MPPQAGSAPFLHIQGGGGGRGGRGRVCFPHQGGGGRPLAPRAGCVNIDLYLSSNPRISFHICQKIIAYAF